LGTDYNSSCFSCELAVSLPAMVFLGLNLDRFSNKYPFWGENGDSSNDVLPNVVLPTTVCLLRFGKAK